MTKREIKFRVFGWELDEEKWVLNPYNKIYTSGKLVIEESFFSRNIGERYVEQYTGLKDANGVEIYEGDYLLTVWSDFEVIEEFGEVQFVDGAWRVISSYGDDLIHEWIDNGTSVQGNIHEQPEWRV